MSFEALRFESVALLRPLLARLPRGYGKAYRLLLGPICSTYRGDALLKAQLKQRLRIFYDRRLSCHVLADVGDAGSRNHYVLGRYYENFVPLIIKTLLGEADTFVDVGANRGVHTMFAARYLTRGRVLSFEPNPRTYQVLQAHLTINGLRNVFSHNLGLAEQDGTLSLNLFGDDAPSGCSFIDKQENPVIEQFEVPIRRLDQIIESSALAGKLLVKIDTEGYDHNVIRGMGNLLDTPGLAILTEVVDEWLKKTGSSAQSLFDDLTGRGFLAYVPTIRFSGFNESISLQQVTDISGMQHQFDLLFAKPGLVPDPASRRL